MESLILLSIAQKEFENWKFKAEPGLHERLRPHLAVTHWAVDLPAITPLKQIASTRNENKYAEKSTLRSNGPC